MRVKSGGILVLIALFAATSASAQQPGPPPGAADIKAYHDCQNTTVKKLDDGKRAADLVAKDLAAHCQKQYEAMSAAVLKMFGKPAWMSNYDSSLATVQASRDPNSALNREQSGR